jgi:CDP-glucose 4,6-dehydratase
MDERTSPWNGRRVLVTGSTGFLGGWVTRELLAAGASVVGLTEERADDEDLARPRLAGRLHVLRGRVENVFRVHSALAVHEVAAVFHLAAPTDGAAPDRGTAAVLDAVRRYDPRVPVVTARPAVESARGLATPLPVGVARFGELFGGGDRDVSRIVPATIVGLLTGDRGPRTADEPGRRDFVYARDAARACLKLAEAVAARPGPHPHDVAFRSGWELTAPEMATVVRAAFDGRDPVAPHGRPPANPLDWYPETPFAVAVTETVAWYRRLAPGRFTGTKPDDPTRRAA